MRNTQASRSDATAGNNNTERPSEMQKCIQENAAVEVNQNCVCRFICKNHDFTDKLIPYNRFCSSPQIFFIAHSIRRIQLTQT